MYAQVVLGLPISGPFDYSVPSAFAQKIKIGARVKVNFRDRKRVAYVVGLADKTNIAKTKPLLGLIDETGILDKNMLLFTRELSDYYCCSWGEAIEAALPDGLRKGRNIPQLYKVSGDTSGGVAAGGKAKEEIILAHDPCLLKRWDIYIPEVNGALSRNKSAIILLPGKNFVIAAEKIIRSGINPDAGILYKRAPLEMAEWAKIKNGEIRICVGMRSAIFAPFTNLGLIIIDEEQSEVYKQDQSPHYNARELAFMRRRIEGARLILGAGLPSLESFYLASKGKARYIQVKRGGPEIKIIDMKSHVGFHGKKGAFLSKYLEDSMASVLNSSAKVLLFLNRSGFATHAACHVCGEVLKCPRCNISLVYHLKEGILSCHHCNFRVPPPKICPKCSAGYIKYSGIGTERIENELCRMFPAARIKRLDKENALDINGADIFISTSSIIRQARVKFDLTGVLFIDNSLNQIDFRAAEKAMALLVNLLGLTQKKMVVQTRIPGHHCFAALQANDNGIFYKEELRQRKQLKFPPYRHICLVKARGKSEDRVRLAAESLFRELTNHNNDKAIEVVSVSPGAPPKLRGNFYWQVLLKSPRAELMSKFLKTRLRKVRQSGIIVTVDMDPL